MMNNYFTFSATFTDLLFKGFNANTTGGFVATAVGVACLAILHEALKSYRSVLLLRADEATPAGAGGKRGKRPADEHTPLIRSVLASQRRKTHSWRARLGVHLLQTSLHALQLIIAYLLMLIVMSYDAWFLVAAAVGAAAGYAAFGHATRHAVARTVIAADAARRRSLAVVGGDAPDISL